MRHFFVLTFLLSTIFATAQSAAFKSEEVQQLLLNELNRFRAEKGLDTLENNPILKNAATMSSTDMMDEESDKTAAETSAKYLNAAGATSKGFELTSKAVVAKGKEQYNMADIVRVLTQRWEKGEKTARLLLDPSLKFCGISATTDENGEKAYFSAFFGGYDVLNTGAKEKKQLLVPFNTVASKLQGPDPKACKSCNQFKNYETLQQGLSVENNKIILRYANAKELKKILKKPTDGLAVDIVQRGQYANPNFDIVDNNLPSKGVMSKVLYKEKFFASNKLLSKDKKANKKIKGLEVVLGKFNPKITGPFELNLLVIQNEKVCKTIIPGYTEKNEASAKPAAGLLPMSTGSITPPPFEPRNQSSILNFLVPFQKNKSEFLASDMEPFLKALDEPDFIVEGLYIYAYSSIEGDSVANTKLQQKRAESVVKALQSRQTTQISPTIIYRDSWGLFLLENEEGKYGDLVKQGKTKTIERLNSDRNLLEELEPILAKERFAEIILDVTYDVSGEKESKFAVASLGKAIKSGNSAQGTRILDFMSKRITEGKYKAEILDTAVIPANPELVALANNKLFHQYQLRQQLDEDDLNTLDGLLKLKPEDPTLLYNSMFCKIKLDTLATISEHQKIMQFAVTSLNGKMDSSLVSQLHIEWQFKIMESSDTLPDANLITEACMERIRGYYNIKEASPQNSLKLYEVYCRIHDYANAASTLETYLKSADVADNLLFLYLSAAARSKEKYSTSTFAKAMKLAKERQPEKYCKLLGAPYMSFQILENPEVKKLYQSSCEQ